MLPFYLLLQIFPSAFLWKRNVSTTFLFRFFQSVHRLLLKSDTFCHLFPFFCKVFTWNPLCHFLDRKSTRLNSSHVSISYAVFCLKKKRKFRRQTSASITSLNAYRLDAFSGLYT